MADFKTDLERGAYGEKIVAAALAARGHKITDVRYSPSYQFRDIDFLLEDKSGRRTSIEVKNDIRSNDTGNVFIEMFNNNNVRRKYRGWFLYCEAQYFAFLQ